MGGPGSFLPLAPLGDDSDDDPDPRGKDRPPASKASSSKAPAEGKATGPLPPKASSSSSAKASAKAKVGAASPPLPPASPSSPEFLVGGGGASISPFEPKAKGKAKAKAKGKAKAKPLKPLVPAIGEGFVWYENYTAPLMHRVYGNWTFHCTREGCPNDCKRTLGVIPRNCKKFGDLEPLAFLHAWRDCTIDPRLGHRKSPVRDEDVKTFYEDHVDELEALRDMFYSGP